MLRRLSKGIGANAFGQVVNIAIQLLLVPILAAHWGLERYGVWLLIATIPAYLLVSDFGFAKACIIDMTMKTAKDDREGALATFQTTWVLVLAITTVLIALIIGTCTLLPDHLFGKPGFVSPLEARMALILMGIYGTLILSCTVFSGGFQCSGNFATESALMSLLWLLEGVSVMVVVMLGGGLVAAAGSYLVCRTIGLCVLGVVMRRLAPWIQIGIEHANMRDMRRLLSPAAAMMVVPLANAGILQGTALAIGWAASAAAVPAFVTVRTISRFGIQLISIVTRASMPEFTTASSRGQHLLQVRIILLIIATSAAVLLPIALVLVLFGQRIIAAWTHGVVHAPPLLIVTMVGMMLANGLWTPLSNTIIAINRQSLFTFRFMCLAVASTPFTYILARRIGATGGAIAMLAVDLVMCVVVLRIVGRLFARPGEIVQAIPMLWQDSRALYKRVRQPR